MLLYLPSLRLLKTLKNSASFLTLTNSFSYLLSTTSSTYSSLYFYTLMVRVYAFFWYNALTTACMVGFPSNFQIHQGPCAAARPRLGAAFQSRDCALPIPFSLLLYAY